ncbi:MAG: DMT family transporter [Pikeienuella sp.]|uniref:DMT family transporter n=1 Tax=Pikeienuella sp. TaxID=2831957 RepID=UPI00391A724A
MSLARAERLPVGGFVLLAFVSLFWGLNWPGMKIALSELPIWWFRVLSVGVGAVGLMAIAWASTGALRPTRRELRPLLICALFNIVGWHLFTGYGVSLMPAGRASIIAFTMPVWAALLGALILGERITAYKVAGLVLGVAALAVLIGPDLMALSSAPAGALFMLGAALSWATGTVLFKKYEWDSPVSALIGWQLLIGLAVILPGALILEPAPDLTALSAKVWIALLYLFALPMIFCQWAFFKVVRMFPAAIASIGTLAVPVIGVYSSALILGEIVGWREVVSMALTCAALTAVMVLPALRRG